MTSTTPRVTAPDGARRPARAPATGLVRLVASVAVAATASVAVAASVAVTAPVATAAPVAVAAPAVAPLAGAPATPPPARAAAVASPAVSTAAHVATIGWMPAVTDGATAGTTGRALDLQALRVTTTVPGTGIRYRAHVATVGWQPWRTSPDTIGTTGRSLRLEALQITLTGDAAARYGIEYRAHVAGIGWQPWRAEGAVAGTTGQGRAVEAVEVRLAPLPSVSTSAHVATIGWMPAVTDGATAGTTGRALDLQALRVTTTVHGTGIRYRAHVATVGWQPWRTSPDTIGTTGRSLRLEALQITLTGDAAARYGIEYRAHVAGIGWQPWRAEGAVAGTTGQGRAVEAVEVRLASRTRITATADTGMAAAAQGVFAGMGARRADLNLVLGDLSYEPIGREPAYCAMVRARVSGPTLVLAGNHEDVNIREGTIENFARCLPDRVGVTGAYGKDYWVDSGPVRTILISPSIALSTGTKTYRSGTAAAAWLTAAIRQARAEGRWVVVGMHLPCLTVGIHGCASHPELTDLLIRERVDLVLAGHDHNYSRSHQLGGTTGAPVVVDRDGQFVRGSGTVFAVVGNGGHEARTVGPQTALWAAVNGTNSPGGFVYGFADVDATTSQLSYRLVRTSGGTLTDGFTLTRP
ncbi:hypothetical protein GCM10023168_01150 [Fodinibacter luteus]|uniref:Calcineurin-like phosphoesterase domain-containing protein n=1 Tax=Fodinibacter luteus TaxID=552064 RepID=A0ABP8JVY2_9MICO